MLLENVGNQLSLDGFFCVLKLASAISCRDEKKLEEETLMPKARLLAQILKMASHPKLFQLELIPGSARSFLLSARAHLPLEEHLLTMSESDAPAVKDTELHLWDFSTWRKLRPHREQQSRSWILFRQTCCKNLR